MTESFLKRCLLVYPIANTFVHKDLTMLSDLGVSVHAHQVKPSKNPFLFLLRQFWLLILSLWKTPCSHRVVSWFSDYHSLFPLLLAKLFGVPSLVIVGGFDAVSDPVNAYGIFHKKGMRQQIARWNYQLVDRIWVVDATLQRGCKAAESRDGVLSGLQHWMPELAHKIEVTPTGYDPNYWRKTKQKKPQTILTVASITSDKVIHRKGIPLFLEMAQAFPEWTFTIAGDASGLLAKQFSLPKNVRILGRLSSDALVQLYSEQQCYFQASRVEGLPNVLCEAMLCECIPIGQKAFGIETAIGDSGLLFETRPTTETFQKMLSEAQQMDSSRCRHRIIEKFHIIKRKEKWKQYFNFNIVTNTL